MKKSNKRELWFRVNHDFNWEYATLAQIKKDCLKLKELGATRIEIFKFEDSSSVDFHGFCKRFETNDEFKNRINEEKAREKEHQECELRLLQKLKTKYEQ